MQTQPAQMLLVNEISTTCRMKIETKKVQKKLSLGKLQIYKQLLKVTNLSGFQFHMVDLMKITETDKKIEVRCKIVNSILTSKTGKLLCCTIGLNLDHRCN